MAKLTGGIAFNGTLDGFSAYTAKGIDGIIIRARGGASKKKIATLPGFVNVRRNNSEFAGCAKMSAAIRRALHSVSRLKDHNISAPLNGLLRKVLVTDTENPWGQRNVLLSQQKTMLEGFGFNKYHLFNSIMPGVVHCSINRQTVTATIQIPALLHGYTFNPVINLPMYRWHAAMAVIPDMVYGTHGYMPAVTLQGLLSVDAVSDWQPVNTSAEAFNMQLAIPYNGNLPSCCSLVVAIGIGFGIPVAGNNIELQKYKACGKILAVA